MKYFIYVRKSTEDEERQVMSIEAQLEELKQYALKENLKISETFIESKSAKTPGRPVFNQMLEQTKLSKEPLGLLVWHPDRLARNSVDGGQIIYLIDTGKIVSLKSPTFWFEPTPQGLFMLQVAFGQSKYYSDNLSENIRRGNRQKLRRGEWTGLAPLGYVNNPNTRNIEPDPVKSKIIKRTFKEYAEGHHTLESLAEKLFLWGITSRSGKRVGYHTVSRILSNPIYIGLIVINGETYQGSFKPIISKGLFDRVQKVLSLRSKPRKRKHKHDFPFLGLLICGECGASITAQHAKGNGGMYRYYRCTKKLNPCSQKYLREDLIIDQLKEKLKRVTLSKSDADKMLKQVAEWKKTEDLSATALVQQLDEDIKKTELKLDKLVNTFLDGDIDKNIYLAKKDELLHKKTALIEKKASFLKKGNNWLEPLKEWILEASSVDELASSKNYEDIKRFFEKIGTNRRLLDRRVEMDLKMPWNILSFSDDTLKEMYHDSVRSTREKFCEKRVLPVWWR